MNLSEIWPKKEVESRIKSKLSIIELSDFEKIVKRKSGSCHEIGAFMWDYYASSNECIHDPMHFVKSFQTSNPNLLREMEALMGKKLLKDIYYVKAEITDSSIKYRVVSELLVANIWPDNIHLSDIEFSNPYSPIPKNSGIPFQKCKGLGLMPTLLESAYSYAKFQGLSTISLTAATLVHYELFKRHGFKLSDTRAANVALEYGQGIPMVKKI